MPISALGIITIAFISYMACYRPLARVLGVFENWEQLGALIAAFCYFFLAIILGIDKWNTSFRRSEWWLLALWFFWAWATAISIHYQWFEGSLFPREFRDPLVCLGIFAVLGGAFCRFNISVILWGLVYSGCTLVVLTLIGGEFQQAAANLGSYRLGAETHGNANGYAYIALLAVIGTATLLLKKNQEKHTKLFLIALYFVFTLLIVLSGSRKAFLGEFFFSVSILLFHDKGSIALSPRRLLLSLFIFGSLSGIAVYTMGNTQMGNRLIEAFVQEQEATKGEQRLAGRGTYYTEGYDIASRFPIFGVGLGRYRFYQKWGEPSHSDYIEVLTGTGIPGFIIYFSVFLLLLLKLRRRTPKLPAGPDRSYLKAMQFAVITILIVAIGRWNYNDYLTWIMMAGASLLASRSATSVSSDVSSAKSPQTVTTHTRHGTARL
jgi:O-antigen ligase